MSVLTVDEAANSGHMEENTDGIRTFHRTFYVVTSTGDDGALTATGTAAEALGLPALWSTFSQGNDADASAVVRDRRPVRHPKNRKFWTVDIVHETLPGFGEEGEDGEDSILRVLPEIRFFFVPYDKVVEKDINNKPIVNSAGQPFGEATVVEAHRLAVSITRNEATYIVPLARQYIDTINSDVVFGGVPQFAAKITVFDGTRRTSPTELWWEINYEIQFADTDWLLRLEDRGFYEINSDNPGTSLFPNLVRIRDSEDQPQIVESLLDGNGGALGKGLDAVELTFHVRRERAFSVLNLPPLVITP